MCTRNLPGDKGRPARKAVTAICGLMSRQCGSLDILKLYGPPLLVTGTVLPSFYISHIHVVLETGIFWWWLCYGAILCSRSLSVFRRKCYYHEDGGTLPLRHWQWSSSLYGVTSEILLRYFYYLTGIVVGLTIRRQWTGDTCVSSTNSSWVYVPRRIISGQCGVRSLSESCHTNGAKRIAILMAAGMAEW
jgi:hypothetical protein